MNLFVCTAVLAVSVAALSVRYIEGAPPDSSVLALGAIALMAALCVGMYL